MNPKALQVLKLSCGSVRVPRDRGHRLNVSPAFPQAMAGTTGTVHWTPDFLYIIKPLGAFMLVMGVLAPWPRPTRSGTCRSSTGSSCCSCCGPCSA